MTVKKVKSTAEKVLNVIGSVVATAAIVEVGYLGGKMLESDIEYTAKTINNKVNPTVMKKRHFWSKPEKFNLRTKKFVADKKKPVKKSK